MADYRAAWLIGSIYGMPQQEVTCDGVPVLSNGSNYYLYDADFTKDLAVRSGLKALEEFMLAAASAASYNFPAAAAHTTAGGMALAVAAAAGGASAGLGAAASAAERGGAGGASGRAPSAGAANGPGAANGAPGGGGSNLERLDVPVSYNRPSDAAAGIVVNINVAGPVGKDTVRAIGEQVRRAIDKTKPQGART